MNTTEIEPSRILRMSPIPKLLHFAVGLAPFVNARTYNLYLEPKAPPFLRMECTETDLAFVLIDPFAVKPDYRPEFSDSDIEEVGLKSCDKPLILAITNLSRGARQATINLAGPLLINPATGNGKQVVLVNATQYAVRHPLQ